MSVRVSGHTVTRWTHHTGWRRLIHPAQIVTLKEQLLRLILVNLEMSHETKKIDMFENVGNENQLSSKSKLATPV